MVTPSTVIRSPGGLLVRVYTYVDGFIGALTVRDITRIASPVPFTVLVKVILSV
jgi:hypothetical protein